MCVSVCEESVDEVNRNEVGNILYFASVNSLVDHCVKRSGIRNGTTLIREILDGCRPVTADPEIMVCVWSEGSILVTPGTPGSCPRRS